VSVFWTAVLYGAIGGLVGSGFCGAVVYALQGQPVLARISVIYGLATLIVLVVLL
jgi:hypothetical protein